MEAILGIDLGIRTGLALFSKNATLIWHWSHNFGNRKRLRQGIHTILMDISKKWKLQFIVMEGSTNVGKLWHKKGLKINVPVYFVSPERWRKDILGTGNLNTDEAKKLAIKYAREIIIDSGLSPPKLIHHDAAEAILIGLWGIRYLKEEEKSEELFYR